MSGLRAALDRLPRPIAEALRALRRRLPPRDPRFLLQDLETPEKRAAFFASPHYARFAAREAAYWAAREAPDGPADTASSAPDAGTAPERPRFSSFLEHPVLQAEHQRRAVPGEAGLWPWMAREFAGCEHALVLGAGEGRHCRLLVDLGIARRVTALDIAEGAVRRANAAFAAEGYPIRYETADLNFAQFPEGEYDLILAMHALHHLIDLEGLFGRLSRALKPGAGRMIVEDYTGPLWLEFPAPVRRVVLRWDRRLPDRLVRSPEGRRARPVFRDRWWVQRDSPFESIRSAAIPRALRAAPGFRIETWRDLGGGLAMPLLDPVISNFDPADEEANAILRAIAEDDGRLTAERAIPNFYGFAVAARAE